MQNRDLSPIEGVLGYNFKDKELLRLALTHSSYSATHNNEQLEFLGDAVIQLAVTQRLYAMGGREGEMTERRQRLVSHRPLKKVSERLGLPNYILKGNSNIGEKALSSVYEAVVGAIFADGGFEAAQKFVDRTLISPENAAPQNFKGRLQEYTQGIAAGLPAYKTVCKGGTPNAPIFESCVSVCGKTFRAEGGSKHQAEMKAAEKALKEFTGD